VPAEHVHRLGREVDGVAALLLRGPHHLVAEGVRAPHEEAPLIPEDVALGAAPPERAERRGPEPGNEAEVEHREVLGIELPELRDERRHLLGLEGVRLLLRVRLVLGGVEVLDPVERVVRELVLPARRLHDDAEDREVAVHGRRGELSLRHARGLLGAPRLDVRDVEPVEVVITERLDEALERVKPAIFAHRALDVTHLHLVLEQRGGEFAEPHGGTRR
jgi:hypothetical protein